MTGDMRVALHEAGHAAAGRSCGWEPGPLTIRGGSAASGCTTFRPPVLPQHIVDSLDPSMPFCSWPGPLYRRLADDVLILLAGSTAALMLTPVTEGRQDDVAERAAVLLPRLPPVTDEARIWAVQAVGDAGDYLSDEEKVAKTARTAFCGDAASANSWLEHMTAATRFFVSTHEKDITRLAGVAMLLGTMSGEQVAAVLAGDEP